jgi:hypothetical protein
MTYIIIRNDKLAGSFKDEDSANELYNECMEEYKKRMLPSKKPYMYKLIKHG